MDNRDRSPLRTLFVLFSLFLRVSACPTSCVCMWKYGKQTVECVNKDLLVIPDGVDSATQVLEFSGNNLAALREEKFLKMDLINLQRIRLARCGIRTIDDRTFAGLTNLVELDLANNLLETIPSTSFRDCPSLMRLTLSGNPLRVVKRMAFSHLPILNTLELQRCEITTIEEGAFQGLYSLEWLHLDDNKMSEIKGLKYLPKSLKGIHLQDNPWICDCHLIELKNWMDEFNIPKTMEPICNGPIKFQYKSLKNLLKSSLACLPEISPTTFYLEVSEGRNISLLCHVKASPEAHVYWSFEGQLLQNDSILSTGDHLLYYIEEGKEDKQSELFIYNTNKNDNGTFVCNAENPAGMTHSNFTVKVVLKKVPTKDFNSEINIDVIIVASAAVSTFLLMLILIVSFLKCRTNAKIQRKRNSTKTTLSNSTKDSLLRESVEEFPESLKSSSKGHYVNDEESAVTSLVTCGIKNSPSKRFQEQNPDLINGTDGLQNENALLNPIKLIDSASSNQLGHYRTLPSKSRRGRLSGRCSMEAEFLARPSYVDYSDLRNIRYTADGYPVRNTSFACNRSDSSVSTEPCCPSGNFQWPSCLPGNLVLPVEKKCVGAQTEKQFLTACDNLSSSNVLETGEFIQTVQEQA